MFWIKKIVGLLLSPLAILLGLLVAGLFLVWRGRGGAWSKRLVVFCIVSLFAVSCGATGQLMLAPLEWKYPALVDPNTAAEATRVVVLGGGYEHRPNHSVTSELSTMSTVRLNEGIRLHRAIDDTELVVSGAAIGESGSTAQGMADLARQLGVPPDEITLLDTPLDTAEEAEAVASLSGEDETVVVVTSASHMPRAMGFFEREGVDAIPAPTHHLTTDTLLSAGEWIPAAHHVYRVERAIYEYVGLLWMSLGGS